MTHPKEVVKEGDQVTVKIVRLDPERKRIGLSIKQVAEAQEQATSASYAALEAVAPQAEEPGFNSPLAAELTRAFSRAKDTARPDSA